MLFATQLALDEIDDKNVLIILETLVSMKKKNFITQLKEIKDQGAKLIIGPITNEEIQEVKKYRDIIFISPSNINPRDKYKCNKYGYKFRVTIVGYKANSYKKEKNRKLLFFILITNILV